MAMNDVAGKVEKSPAMSNSASLNVAAGSAVPNTDDAGMDVPQFLLNTYPSCFHLRLLPRQTHETGASPACSCSSIDSQLMPELSDSFNNHREYQGAREFPATKDGQAAASRLRNLPTLFCSTRTPETPRALSYQRKAFRVSRVHKMLRAPRFAPASPAEAAPDYYTIFPSS
jgi:hypothetical protein